MKLSADFKECRDVLVALGDENRLHQSIQVGGCLLSLERVIMRLKNILIVVNDIEASKKYYHDLFGLNMILDNDGNMILTEGLVLQDVKYWKQFLDSGIISKNNHAELYFEEKNIEEFVEKLERLYPDTEYVNKLMTHSWGQKVIRFYDLDGNLIEVGTPIN